MVIEHLQINSNSREDIFYFCDCENLSDVSDITEDGFYYVKNREVCFRCSIGDYLVKDIQHCLDIQVIPRSAFNEWIIREATAIYNHDCKTNNVC